MAADNETSAIGRELAARLNEKIQHVNELIAQKLEYQSKFLEQRLEGIEKVNAEKVLGFSIRLEEALAEIRGYKDILQQQLTLLDSAIKKAHARMDELDAKGTTHGMGELQAVRKELQDGLHELELMMTNVKKLEDAAHDQEVIQETKEKDPLRKFVEENKQKLLLFILTGLGLFLLKNLSAVVKFFSTLSGGGGE